MTETKKKGYALKRDYAVVGEFLKDARMRAGLTQREVSAALGYTTPQHISNFECGIALPPLKKLGAMIHLYKLDPRKTVDIILKTERQVMLKAVSSRRSS